MPSVILLLLSAMSVLVRSFATHPTAGARKVDPDDTSDYRPGHLGLLREIPRADTSAPASPLGGIVVPVARDMKGGLPGLWLALGLALATGAPLVLILSRKARKADLPIKFRQELGSRLVMLYLDEVHASPAWTGPFRMTSRTARHRLSRHHRHNDVGQKRNIGLTVAALMGWRTVLFLDDDVSAATDGPTLDGAGLTSALVALEQDQSLRIIGWTLTKFPDNSMYGHSRRLAGLEQEIFVGGGALLVRIDKKVPFFPDIYNEDWLFLIAAAWTSSNSHRALGWAGQVDQLLYNPFRLTRARSEEAGEIIGECLLNQLETEKWPPPPRTPEYWQVCRDRRALVLEEASAALANEPMRSGPYQALYTSDDVLRVKVLHALEASWSVNQKLEPDWLATYVQAWVDDVQAWALLMKRMLAHDLDDLPADDPLAAALRALGAPKKVSIKVWLKRRRGLTRQRVA